MSIKIKIEGFDVLLSKIEKSSQSINKFADRSIRESAQIMNDSLKSQMQKTGVDGGLISRMPAPTIEHEGNIYSAKAGYKKGNFDSNNLSDGYKALFLNYGTPNRTNHGKVKARGFIAKAKKSAKPKIKKSQQQALEDILKGLE